MSKVGEIWVVDLGAGHIRKRKVMEVMGAAVRSKVIFDSAGENISEINVHPVFENIPEYRLDETYQVEQLLKDYEEG